MAWMLDGWLYAHRYLAKPIRCKDVLTLGRIVEPRQNLHGLRTVGVRVGLSVKMDSRLVPDALDRLLANQPPIGEALSVCNEWYRQYEEIHPFRDGNGRTGNILWNWLCGTLPTPLAPPDLWL